jgi:hypothetical protein
MSRLLGASGTPPCPDGTNTRCVVRLIASTSVCLISFFFRCGECRTVNKVSDMVDRCQWPTMVKLLGIVANDVFRRQQTPQLLTGRLPVQAATLSSSSDLTRLVPRATLCLPPLFRSQPLQLGHCKMPKGLLIPTYVLPFQSYT